MLEEREEVDHCRVRSRSSTMGQAERKQAESRLLSISRAAWLALSAREEVDEDVFVALTSYLNHCSEMSRVRGGEAFLGGVA